MAGHSFVRFGLSWIDMSILSSQVLRQALMEGCKAIKARNLKVYRMFTPCVHPR